MGGFGCLGSQLPSAALLSPSHVAARVLASCRHGDTAQMLQVARVSSRLFLVHSEWVTGVGCCVLVARLSQGQEGVC